MEKKMETTVAGLRFRLEKKTGTTILGYVGTTMRINFIPS